MNMLNFNDLKEMEKKLSKADRQLTDMANNAIKEIATKALRTAIDYTPVADSTPYKRGGTLRRGWTAQTHNDALGGVEIKPAEYIKTVPIVINGPTRTIDIINPVEYALFVEYGHRAGESGWVEGRFMLQKAITQTEPQVEGIVSKHIGKILKDLMA